MKFPNSAIAVLLSACCLAKARDAAAQTALPKLNLSKPDWTAEDGFSSIPSIRQLSNGSVIAADQKEVEVRLLAANGTTTRQLGRKGSGPSEYTMPTMLIALPNDSTLLLDRDARRVLVLNPSGRFTSTRPIPTVFGKGAEFLAAADRQGRVYFRFEPLEEPGVNGPPTNAIARWLRPRETFDTVAIINLEIPKLVEREKPKDTGKDTTIVRMAGLYKTTYGPTDDWVVAPSGRVAIVRAEPYHVEWTEINRTRSTGANVAYTPVAVTEADKKFYEPKGPPYYRPYAKTKSPFVTGSAVVDESENIWVRRFEPFGSTTRRWDVFNAKGTHLGTVPISANCLLLAINKLYAYCARTDSDGLVWLERYSR